MSKRTLYLAAYDISAPRRLRRVLGIVKDFATGGQKSAYECFLDKAEKHEILNRVLNSIDPHEDRFFLLRLKEKPRVHVLGIAVQPADPSFFYQG